MEEGARGGKLRDAFPSTTGLIPTGRNRLAMSQSMAAFPTVVFISTGCLSRIASGAWQALQPAVTIADTHSPGRPSVKRLIIALVILATLAALTFWGNRLAGRTLDAELGPLLSRQLGLPVTLAPITAHLLQLKASSPKLVMGDPRDPAIVATNVQVTLAWDDVLRGEIRLVGASATDLMVRTSRWPSSDSPLPTDYRFLDQWIPNTLQLQTGRFVSDSGDTYPLTQLQWQRQADGGATAQWSDARAGGDIAFDARLKSLDDLLRLAPVELALDVTSERHADSPIALKASIQPGSNAAYSVQFDVQAAGMTARVTATGQKPWSLPDQSETTIPLLASDKLLALIKTYDDSDADDEPAAGMAATLPSFRLPAHQGHVAISEFRIGDQISRENAFDFTSGEHGLQVSALTSEGPQGVLSGELGIASDDQGWAVNVDATIQARDATAGTVVQFVGAHWQWRNGHARLSGRGTTGNALLNSLSGDMSLEGQYKGSTEIPITIAAQLDNRPDEFALDHLAITLGEGQLNGSARLSGTDPRLLVLDLKGTRMDLEFLFPTEDSVPKPGIAIPEFLGSLPKLDLNLSIELEELRAPGLSLTQAKASLQRNEAGGKFVASARGAHLGTLALTLDASTPPNDTAQFQLAADFSQLDIANLFRQTGVINSRSTGSLKLHSRGSNLKDIFAAMQGQAKLKTEIRADNNWRRAPIPEEKLALSGNASLVLDGERIVGVKIAKLDVDSIDQDLTGDLHLTAGRSPWLVADLKSDMLNVTGLLALLPESAQQADREGLVPSLERLGATQVTLKANALSVMETTLSNVHLKVASAPNLMTIEQFDFVSQDLTLKTKGRLSWKGNRATLDSTAQLTDVDIDQFLFDYPGIAHVPVSGTVQLHSEGRQLEELIRNITGTINLNADARAQANSPEARRSLAITASRLDDGVQAEISSLQWGESELTGSVRYHRTSPPTVEVEIHGGTLSLLPWENAHLSGKRRSSTGTPTTDIDSIARSSAELVESVLLAPLRFLGEDESAPPSARIFSADPIDLNSLKAFNMNLSGQLNSLVSHEIEADDVNFTSHLRDGQLDVQVGSSQFSGGSGELSLTLDSTTAPPAIQVTSTFNNVRGIKARTTFPRSGFVSLTSHGQSQADLAANVNGLIFVDMGRGPFDYANSAFLTANILTAMFQTLIPGISRQQHELECGTVLGTFQNGMGDTPYGFAGRTNQASLVGHLSVDLHRETMEMNIDSRGRQGMGISVSSIFSNTVRIQGSLSNPRIVPNPTGIAWRAWAAVTTGGLSILGETLLRRIWASENPCKSVKRIIVEKECPVNPIAASSPMVCPKA